MPGGTDHISWAKTPDWAQKSRGVAGFAGVAGAGGVGGAGGQGSEVVVQFARGTNSQAMMHMAEAGKARNQ